MTINYYQKHKEKLRKEARERHQNFSEEEKEKRQKKMPNADMKIFLKKKMKKKVPLSS